MVVGLPDSGTAYCIHNHRGRNDQFVDETGSADCVGYFGGNGCISNQPKSPSLVVCRMEPEAEGLLRAAMHDLHLHGEDGGMLVVAEAVD